MPTQKVTVTNLTGVLAFRNDATPSMPQCLSAKRFFRLHPQRTELLIERCQCSAYFRKLGGDCDCQVLCNIDPNADERIRNAALKL
jgi:hypothetical protein